MGKDWDRGVPGQRYWEAILSICRPGAYLLAFGGTGTYHRLATAIEDAGWEIRDMVEWVYGCLSEDTEILTESGYKHLHKLTQYDRIGVYDITNNIYKWERPQRYSVYKVHQDTAYRIKSDYTDQIVSRNHRCLVEREGKLVFIQAEELNEVEYMPTLSEDFYSLQEGHRKLLLKELLRKGKGLAQTIFSKWERNKKSEERIEVRKEPSLERWSNLLEETRKLQADKICEVSEGVFTDGEKRWICNGASFDNGSILGDMFRENPSSTSYQSRPTGQPTGKPDVISIKQGTQTIRRARVEKIEYSGIIFCPTVSTGAFVARRNGQVFITGNSGFPKSLNVGKAIDKLQGNEREDLGRFEDVYVAPDGKNRSGGRLNADYKSTDYQKYNNETRITKGTSEWEGYGTALKPAHEPICMAMKPREGTFAENCLKWGTGGINIDESRVEATKEDMGDWDRFKGHQNSNTIRKNMVDNKTEDFKDRVDNGVNNLGRFPANFIHDNSEEVRECFPETKSVVRISEDKDEQQNTWSLGRTGTTPRGHNDSGNASRYFKSIIYQAKANKSERNKEGRTDIPESTPQVYDSTQGRFPANLIHDNSEEVRECFPETKTGGSGNQYKRNLEYEASSYQMGGKGNNDIAPFSGNASHFFKSIIYQAKANKSERNKGCEGNRHPTVKPIALTEYLARLILPPEQGEPRRLFVPFAGSGSEMIGAYKAGWDEIIGVELEQEYVEIARARLDYWTKQPSLMSFSL